MGGYADCLAGFVTKLGLEQPHVLGLSSFGGRALALEPGQPSHPAIPKTRSFVCVRRVVRLSASCVHPSTSFEKRLVGG